MYSEFNKVTSQSHKINRCPICNKECNYHMNSRYKPFCSDRCKLIDLGEWANETRRIPTEEFELVQDGVDF